MDLQTAAVLEGENPSGLLPSSVADRVLRNRAEEFAELLGAELQSGFVVHNPEVVLASKATRGRRPIAILSVWERTIFRALVGVLQAQLPTPERGSQAFETFKLAPLDQDAGSFVVMADVAAFFQYVDHGLLEHEITAQTGESLVASAIVTLLSSLTGHKFGLPQTRTPSIPLGETVLRRTDRSLRRSGFRTWRYNDDFRIAADGRAEAHTALEALETHLRREGLSLNEEKTSVKRHEDYERWAYALQRRIEEVEREGDFDLVSFSEYGEIEPEPGSDDLHPQTTTAHSLVDRWAEAENSGRNPKFGPEAVVDRQILTTGLGVCASAEDSRLLPYCSTILDSEPSLTPIVARYFASLMGPLSSTEFEVDRAVDAILTTEQGYVSDWQAIWLTEPLRRSSGLTPTQQQWLEGRLAARSHLLRAAAAEVLATAIGVGTRRPATDCLLSRFDEAPEGVRARLVSAIALASDDYSDPDLQAVIGERPFYRWIAEEIYASR